MKSYQFFLLLLVSSGVAHAITIPTVPIGNAGNAPDSTGFGSVNYDFRIGTYEVTYGQYADFLNAVAASDTYGLYSTSMGTTTHGGITRTGAPGNYVYTGKPDAVGQGPNGSNYAYASKPVAYVSWYDALRFANWLHNGQPTGAQDASTTEDGAYNFSGPTSVNERNADAIWFLPNENEWYKSAYYDAESQSYYEYPTSSDLQPDNNLPSADSGNSANYYNGITTGNSAYRATDVGAYQFSVSPYATYDQAGGVWDMTESWFNDTFKLMRGSSYNGNAFEMRALARAGVGPAAQAFHRGFRVAAIPEPSTYVLAALGVIGLLAFRRRTR